MLVLTRKKNESIRIADDIILTVVRIRGGKVKLGIECPRKVPIRRSEVPLESLCEADQCLAEQLEEQEHIIL
ncbi:carbon storage regulator [Gimesia fumaroli]|uniref:Translational regulator CsrA n=1 Tax=Gimesia fumaroli TaxID=2527976 RepID=A0A518I9B2_9PLAN|nr:carbon storage regulator [Gimesia fumaroli]QDV49639.1 hypothetical protein Enr17x_16600 [Gimesia fumaroli]